MENSHIEVWQQCLNKIKQEVKDQAFKTWFLPIQPKKLEGNTLTLQVPNFFFYEWLESHYIDQLKAAIRSQLGEEGQLQYVLQQKKTPQKPQVAVQREKPLRNPLQQKERRINRHYGQAPIRDKNEKIHNPFVIPGIKKKEIESQLNPSYTFDRFIEGDCNRLARSAGMAVAKKPGQTAFNPLMIFGNVGLGKTHLAHAIGNEVKKNMKDKVVLYVSSEHFTNQFIESLTKNAISDFVNYYQLVDLLIVDDIQFLAKKQKTQDIFFHIFNHLHQRGKQLILTSDRPPKEMADIEERLISRFKWGLSADLQVPSLETRMAIIQQKMHNDGIELPHNVMEYISYTVRSNVRELEGILISLIAQSALNQRDIDMSLAREVISKFVDDVSQEISIEFIQKIVADYYDIPVEKLREKTRKKLIVTARKLSMYLAKQLSNKSLTFIGAAFGGRDHSTVIHACKSVEAMLQNDQSFKSIVADLKQKIKQNTQP